MTIQRRLKEILVVELNLEDFAPDEIDNDESLFGGRLGLDSIDALEIVYQVEQNFNIPMKEMNEARAAFQSINTLAAFIEARLQG
jgi:acyl carrier protein